MIPADHLLHRIELRHASPDDVPTLIEIKSELAINQEDAPAFRGGFLLGSSVELYMALAHAGQIIIAHTKDDDHIHGFGIAIESEILQNSPLWARRELIDWEPDFDAEHALTRRIGYLDQLAVRPGSQRKWIGALLSCAMMERFIATNHDLVFTTTLVKPIVNAASLPLIARIMGHRIGQLEEHYEGLGHVISALHVLPPKGYMTMRDEVAKEGDAFELKVIEKIKHFNHLSSR